MEFPRHDRHHHHRRGGEEEEYPPPAPRPDFNPPPPYQPSSYYGEYEQPRPAAPLPTHVYHSSHTVGGEFYSPPPPNSDYYAPPPPQPPSAYSYSSVATVEHVSHEYGSETSEHHHRPHVPSFVQHHTHQQDPDFAGQKPTVKVVTKAKTDYSLAIREGKVILAPSDPSDPFQHWIKDEKFSTRVKDEQGFPCFALVNKATGLAMKHSIGATHPVQLIPYNPDVLDESILWTESKDFGDGFRTIRMVNNIRLNVDAFHGDKNHGGVRDGTTIVLWEWLKGDNQCWKIIPY